MSPTKIDLIKEILRGVDSLVAEGTVGSAPDNSHFNDESLQFRTANQLEGKQVYNDGNPTTSSLLAARYLSLHSSLSVILRKLNRDTPHATR